MAYVHNNVQKPNVTHHIKTGSMLTPADMAMQDTVAKNGIVKTTYTFADAPRIGSPTTLEISTQRKTVNSVPVVAVTCKLNTSYRVTDKSDPNDASATEFNSNAAVTAVLGITIPVSLPFSGVNISEVLGMLLFLISGEAAQTSAPATPAAVPPFYDQVDIITRALRGATTLK